MARQKVADRALRLRLSQAAVVAGVSAGQINNWTNRRIWDRPRGTGRHHLFSLDDCFLIALLGEISALGLELNEHAQNLASDLRKEIYAAAQRADDIGGVPDLFVVDIIENSDGQTEDWFGKFDDQGVKFFRTAGNSFRVLGLRRLVRNVLCRYQEAVYGR